MSETNVTRNPRDLSRDLESRETTKRPTAWRAPEVLPYPDPRPGWSHRYIRLSTTGQSDPANISSKLREGYEPVKAEDYPELMMHAVGEGRFKGGVEVGGLLLCRIPDEFMKQRADYYANHNKAQVDSVDNNFMREQDPRMATMFVDRKTKVTFGPK